MGSINTDELIKVSSNWVDNRESIYAGVGKFITDINPYEQILHEDEKNTLKECSRFLKERKDDEGYIGLFQDVEDIYAVLRDVSDVSAILFDCMTVSDGEKYLDDMVFERIFVCYKDLYDLAVQEISEYEAQGNNRKDHAFADAVVYMCGALQQMNESYGDVTCNVLGKKRIFNMLE